MPHAARAAAAGRGNRNVSATGFGGLAGCRHGVAALADEPGSLVAAFAAFHLAQGAAEVHICLDRPNPEAQDLLQGCRGLSPCGGRGWLGLQRGRRAARAASGAAEVPCQPDPRRDRARLADPPRHRRACPAGAWYWGW